MLTSIVFEYSKLPSKSICFNLYRYFPAERFSSTKKYDCISVVVPLPFTNPISFHSSLPIEAPSFKTCFL
jgi:hypothetical protein